MFTRIPSTISDEICYPLLVVSNTFLDIEKLNVFRSSWIRDETVYRRMKRII